MIKYYRELPARHVQNEIGYYTEEDDSIKLAIDLPMLLSSFFLVYKIRK